MDNLGRRRCQGSWCDLRRMCGRRCLRDGHRRRKGRCLIRRWCRDGGRRLLRRSGVRLGMVRVCCHARRDNGRVLLVYGRRRACRVGVIGRHIRLPGHNAILIVRRDLWVVAARIGVHGAVAIVHLARIDVLGVMVRVLVRRIMRRPSPSRPVASVVRVWPAWSHIHGSSSTS